MGSNLFFDREKKSKHPLFSFLTFDFCTKLKALKLE